MLQLFEHAYWFWLAFGGLLLAAELLGTGGYMLWSGISALVVGVIVWLIPITWPWQWIFFAVLTIVVLIAWWYWLKHTKKDRREQRKHINQRGQQLIGRRGVLIEHSESGFGRMTLNDSSWRTYSEQPLHAGAQVEIIDVDGATLIVRAVSQ